MKFTKLFIIAMVVLGFGSCTQKPAQNTVENVKYYRQLLFSETPWDLEKGIHPVSADEAKTVNNYKFTWNEDGTLASVEYNRNGVLLGYSGLRAAKITYSYNGNKQIKHFFNENGDSIKNSGTFAHEFTLDQSGQRIALRFLDENGQPVENGNNIHNYIWTKLDDGMLQEKRYNLAGEETVMNQFCPFYELRFLYDEKGYITRMANYEADTLYNCTAENCGDVGVSYFEFANSEHGDLLRFSVHSLSGQLSNLYWGWAKREIEVDEFGNAIVTVLYDQDDEYLGGKNVPVTKNEYDKHGALVKSISMDVNMNVINNPSNGVAIVEYKYDEQGRRIETLQYDKDLTPIVRNS